MSDKSTLQLKVQIMFVGNDTIRAAHEVCDTPYKTHNARSSTSCATIYVRIRIRYSDCNKYGKIESNIIVCGAAIHITTKDEQFAVPIYVVIFPSTFLQFVGWLRLCFVLLSFRGSYKSP